MPEFYMILARKTSKTPAFFIILFRKINKFSRILHDFCPKMPEFYVIIARKIKGPPAPRLLRLCVKFPGGGTPA